MAVAAIATPLVVLALLVVLVAVLPTKPLTGLGIAAAIGVAATVRARRAGKDAHALAPGEQPALQAAVDRLCAMGDIARPQVVLEDEAQPNSWVIDAPGRPPRLHVTKGLLALLEPHELEAVVAHELSHVAHHDATVMTVVGLPGAVLMRGAGWWPIQLGMLIAGAVGLISRTGTNALSRYRELNADATAVALTGRPSALASALLKVSGRLADLPTRDLRVAAARNGFHLLPVEAPASKVEFVRWLAGKPLVARLNATHPSLECRLAALEAAERRLQTARTPSR